MALCVENSTESFMWFEFRCTAKNTFLHIEAEEDESACRPRRSASMPAACFRERKAPGGKSSGASTPSTRTPSSCSPAESEDESAVCCAVSMASTASTEAPPAPQRRQRTRLPGRKRQGKPQRPSQALRNLYREVAAERLQEALANPAAYRAKPDLSLPPALGQNAWLVGKLRRRIELCLQQAEQGLAVELGDDCLEP